MGVAYNTTCLDCSVEAPQVGDYGFIGYPSVTTERGPRDRMANFGYVYEGFAAARLLTQELEALRTFLLAHRGHRLHAFADGAPAFGDGGKDAVDTAPVEDMTDIKAWWRKRHEQRKAAAVGYTFGYYQLDCRPCHESVQLEHFALIKPFEPTVLSDEAIDAFRVRVLNEEDAFYRAGPLSYGDFKRFETFLKGHGHHSPVASLVPHETSS